MDQTEHQGHRERVGQEPEGARAIQSGHQRQQGDHIQGVKKWLHDNFLLRLKSPRTWISPIMRLTTSMKDTPS